MSETTTPRRGSSEGSRLPSESPRVLRHSRLFSGGKFQFTRRPGNTPTGSTNNEDEQGISQRVYEATLAVLDAESLGDVMAAIEEQTCRLVQADYARLYFADAQQQVFYNVDETGRRTSDVTAWQDVPHLVEVAQGPCFPVAVEAQPNTQPSSPASSATSLTSSPGEANSSKHCLLTPITDPNCREVVMVVAATRDYSCGPFTHNDCSNMHQFAEVMSRVYKNAVRYDEMHHKKKDYEVLYNLAKSIFRASGSRLVVKRILSHAASYVGTERCSLFMYDKERNELYNEEFEGSLNDVSAVPPQRNLDSLKSQLSLSCQEAPTAAAPAMSGEGRANGGVDSNPVSPTQKIAKFGRQRSGSLRFNTKVGIAGYVFRTGKTVSVVDAYKDDRFDCSDMDKELGYVTKTALCTPVRNSRGDIVGVVQLTNKKCGSFTSEDVAWFENFITLCAMALHNVFVTELENRAKIERDALVKTANAIVQPFDVKGLLQTVLLNAKASINADRFSVFTYDDQRHMLVPAVFDVRDDGTDGRSNMIEVPVAEGIAGYVFRTGEALNISDAYQDPRFSKKVDEATGYRTHSIICAPVKHGSKTIGVVELINKRGPTDVFTCEDMDLLQTFTNFIGISLHNARQHEQTRKAEQQTKLAFEIIAYHTHCTKEELDALTTPIPPELMYGSDQSNWNTGHLDDQQKCSFAVQMYLKLAPVAGVALDLAAIQRFVLTVRKNYRNVTYHNWAHAFGVSHCFYTIASNVNLLEFLLPHELIAHLTACLAHDIDHRGKNNAFLKTTSSEMASVYGEKSILEHHHFEHFRKLLSLDGLDIFYTLPEEMRTDILEYIENVILATDLANHFSNVKEVNKFFEGEQRVVYDRSNKRHRQIFAGLLMTACDISAITKPWDQHVRIAKLIYEEFFAQGDAEKQYGKTPIAMMDRAVCNIPQQQLGFIDHICAPTYTALANLLPATQPLLDHVMENRKLWNAIMQKQEADPLSHAFDKGPLYLPPI